MSLTTHVNLLDNDVADPWKDDADAVAAYPGPATPCHQCREIEVSRQSILGLVEQANTLAPSLIEHERSMLKLQSEFRVIRAELSRAVKALRQGLIIHRRCQVCRILIGGEHVTLDLVREPLGTALVCTACYHTLKLTKQTAAQATCDDDQRD